MSLGQSKNERDKDFSLRFLQAESTHKHAGRDKQGKSPVKIHFRSQRAANPDACGFGTWANAAVASVGGEAPIGSGTKENTNSANGSQYEKYS